MNTERCVKCDHCELEDFFWDGKRLCLLYRCRIYREAIEAVRIMDGEAESKDGYLMRAIIKLLYRYPRKNGKQDLDKAIQCIKMLRDHLYGKEDKE